MYILEIIPIRKGIPRDTLSYFSARALPLGALVEIPLQSKQIHGIVIRVGSARDEKAGIRSGNFSLKQVTSVIREDGFPKVILETLCRISENTLIPVGTLLSTFFPESVFEFWSTWKYVGKKINEIRIVELPTPDRYAYYQKLIRESFAKKHSIQFIAPTIHECEKLSHFLKTTTESTTVLCLHGSLTEKKRSEVYKTLETTDEYLAICTTPQLFMIPRNDLGTIVLESLGSPSYTQEFSGYVDFRSIILPLSDILGTTRYLSDSISSAELLDLVDRRKAHIERISDRKTAPAKISVHTKESYNDKNYKSPVFAENTIKALTSFAKHNVPVVIFTARKSVATAVHCRDCGYTVNCPNCSNIMHLVKRNPLSDTDRVFVCNRCDTETPAMNHCPVCMGWNLIPMGITIDAVADEVKNLFPDTLVYKISQDLTKTDTSIKKMINEWQSSPGILIGTQKMIPYLDHVPVVIIASFDHLMSIPAHDTPYRTLWLMNSLLEKTTEHFIVQAKNSDEPTLGYFSKHMIREAIAEDYRLRKEYHFPPCEVLITVTLDRVARRDHLSAKDFLRRPLAPFEHAIQSQFFEQSHTYSITATIHIEHEVWQGQSRERKTLLAFLSSLRQHAEVKVENRWL